MSRGILLWASGDRFLTEATLAIEQIRRVWPGVYVVLDESRVGSEPPMLHRIRVMAGSPFDDTIWMDADTWLLEPVPELFDLLERFDLAAALSAWREVYPVGAPSCFPELNLGILVWRRRPAVDRLLQDWMRRFQEHYAERDGVSHPDIGFFHSQPAFREALFHSGIRFAVLPDEYNWQGSGYVQQRVRIIHKRPDREEEGQALNQDAGRPRTKLLYGSVETWR